MTYYNLCGIKSKHSNISKGRADGVHITNHRYARLPIVKVDKNKDWTWNRCPLGNCEYKKKPRTNRIKQF
jgi:hypothetical protein